MQLTIDFITRLFLCCILEYRDHQCCSVFWMVCMYMLDPKFIVFLLSISQDFAVIWMIVISCAVLRFMNVRIGVFWWFAKAWRFGSFSIFFVRVFFYVGSGLTCGIETLADIKFRTTAGEQSPDPRPKTTNKSSAGILRYFRDISSRDGRIRNSKRWAFTENRRYWGQGRAVNTSRAIGTKEVLR